MNRLKIQCYQHGIGRNVFVKEVLCDNYLQLAAGAGELVDALALRREHHQQMLDLDLLRDRDPAELLDVALSPRVHHRELISARRRSR